MAKVHFLNVDPGDCSIIEHGSGRRTVIDVCDGFTPEDLQKATASAEGMLLLEEYAVKGVSGNYQMKSQCTNPVEYMKVNGISSIFRFILTHPDMDHMDGLKSLADNVPITNFWYSGAIKEKPPFAGSPYREEDWDQFQKFCKGEGAKYINHLAGDKFQFANLNEDGASGGDCIHILAPDANLVQNAQDTKDYNDASYVILYRSAGGKILFSGDAHDNTWEYVLNNYEKEVADCSVLIAPHHGRDSGMNYDFLDVVRPKLTLFGNARSEHLAYNKYKNVGSDLVTSNQAGNVVLEISSGLIDVFVENQTFAKAKNPDLCNYINDQGYFNILEIK